MKNIILGTIAGDVTGSYYEMWGTRNKNFELFRGKSSRFTDDTVMTVAVADWLLTGDALMPVMQEFGNSYPKV